MDQNRFRSIRASIGVSQAEIAQALGMTQGNVSLYENGQNVPVDVARKLIAYASSKGVSITFDDIYGAPKQAA